MRKRTVGVVCVAMLAGVALGGAGCSSSSGGGGTGSDSGTTHHDSGATNHDAGHPKADAHVATDAHVTKDTGASGDTGSDAAAECSPASTASYSPTTYVPAVVHAGACSTAEITAFISACGFSMSASDSACTAWQTANVTDGGVSCGTCIVAPQNNGGVWQEPGAGDLYVSSFPNYAACIQVLDPTHGAACAGAYNNATVCNDIACNTMACFNATDPNAFNNCEQTASTGGCMTADSAQTSACATDFADGGANFTCSPSANTGNQDDDLTYILTLLCGSTADAGARDAGHDAG